MWASMVSAECMAKPRCFCLLAPMGPNPVVCGWVGEVEEGGVLSDKHGGVTVQTLACQMDVGVEDGAGLGV